MYGKILIAFDGSDPSKYALDHAVNIADTYKGELIILSVVPRFSTPLYPDMGPAPITASLTDYQDRVRELYTTTLKEAENDAKEAYPDLKVTSLILEGRPSAIIVEQAEKMKVDLIVMGSRGVGGVTGWILGSTSRRVVDSCTTPILIVKTSR
jgi:nucleotide-binding universal stress UspA family protein